MPVINVPNVVFSDAKKIDKLSIKSLWIDCFKDSPIAVDLFFNKVFEPNRTFVATVDNKLCSMLFLIPCKICGKNAHYLYAACTDVNFRKLGIMSRLIDFALNQAKIMGDSYSVLLPANDNLYDFYSKLGYQKGLQIKVCNIKAKNISNMIKADTNTTFDYLYSRDKCFGSKGNFVQFSQNIIDFAINVNSLYGGQTVVYNNSYAIVSAQYNGVRTITEFASNKQDFKYLINKIFNLCPADSYDFRLNITEQNFKNCITKDFGMILSLDNSEIIDNLYIGLTLD